MNGLSSKNQSGSDGGNDILAEPATAVVIPLADPCAVAVFPKGVGNGPGEPFCEK